MSEKVLLDTGPLVSILNTRDAHHQWACEKMENLNPPLVTCEAVITEAMFLLERSRTDPSAPLRLLEKGDLVVDFQISKEAGTLETLMKRYANVPMSLADAFLVRLSEINKDCRVFTLDKDFKIYRRYGRSVIPVISPW